MRKILAKHVNKKDFFDKKKAVALIVLAVVFCVLTLLKSNEKISRFFSDVVARAIIKYAAIVFGILPFSFFELFFVAFFGTLAFLLVSALVLAIKKRRKRALKRVATALIIALSFGIVYTVAAGFSYTKAQLSVPAVTPDDDIAIEAVQAYFNDFNAVSARIARDGNGNAITPYGFDEMSDKILQTYSSLPDIFPEFFGNGELSENAPCVKKLLNSWFMSEGNFTGVFFAPTGEVNINGDIFPTQLPTTIAHEIAHSKGVMKENEANMLSYIVTLVSDDDFIRYSGFLATYNRMLEVAFYKDKTVYESIRKNLDVNIRKDVIAVNEFWANHGKFQKISSFFNDLYLKISGYFSGVSGYVDQSDIVDTGEVDDEGETVFEITYSAVQKMIFSLYSTPDEE